MSEFIFEIFSEEIPSRMQSTARKNLYLLAENFFHSRDLSPSSLQVYSTPQRLVLHGEGLPLEQKAYEEERRGPRVDAAPETLEKFFQSLGVTAQDCVTKTTEKGIFWVAPLKKPAIPMEQTLSLLMEEILTKLQWPKSMGWNSGSLRWARPIRRLLAVFNRKAIPLDLSRFSLKTPLPFGKETSGHRFMSPTLFPVETFEEYKRELKARYVILDQEERKTIIDSQIRTMASQKGLLVKEDPVLLEEVTGLVEWPVALMGHIDEKFLSIPQEILITSMRHHQKFFSLLNPSPSKENLLAPFFITVANVSPQDGGKKIIEGNESVLRARLSDSLFFFDVDKKVSLEEQREKLKNITFHRQLGTMHQKVQRLETLAIEGLLPLVGPSLPSDGASLLTRACQLSKSDLVTHMVRELPELQGIMGRIYALQQGEPSSVSHALQDYYGPLGPDDPCPLEPVTSALALVDKIDTLVGFFGISEVPTGSKDPYGLRRASLGILRILLEKNWSFNLIPLLMQACSLYTGQSIVLETSLSSLLNALRNFLWDRLKGVMKAKNFPIDIIEAVFPEALSAENSLFDPVKILKKAYALQKALQTEKGPSLKGAIKRVLNILQAEEKKIGYPLEGGHCSPDQFKENAERHLYENFLKCQVSLNKLLCKDEPDYEKAFEELSNLVPFVDEFFLKVTVNSLDPLEKSNRLELLASLRHLFHFLGDFKKLEG